MTDSAEQPNNDLATVEAAVIDAARLWQSAADHETTANAEKWELARLTYENTRSGAGKPKAHDTRLTMKAWSAAIQLAGANAFSRRTAERYRAVYAAVVDSNSATVAELGSFTEAYAIATRAAERLEAAHKAKLEATPPSLAPLPIVVAVKPTQPAVTDAIDADTEVEGVPQKWVEMREQRQTEQTAPLIEVVTALEQERIFGHLQRQIDKLSEVIDFSLPVIETMSSAGKSMKGWLFSSALEELKERIARIDYFIEHGEGEIDTFAREVLGGSNTDA